MSNVKILLISSLFCCSTAAFAQKKVETFYFNTVYVAFWVSKTGEIENAKIWRGVHPSLDDEAVRVV